MPLPVRHLPVLQNWDCQGCANCCHEYRIFVSDAERERIVAQHWSPEELAGLPALVTEGRGSAAGWRLNHRADGACVFLGDTGRCRIHERFGGDAKPLACRVYPFVLVPVGDHWRVSLRYTCPAAAAGQGRAFGEHAAELRAYATEIEQSEKQGHQQVMLPLLQGSQSIAWPDLLRFTDAILRLLQDRGDSIALRWRKCLALAALCRRARFEQVKGTRLAEFLTLVTAGLEGEVARDPSNVPSPSWVGRVLFRLALAAHVRKDHGRDRGPETGSRVSLLRAAWAFARGQGRVPRLHGLMPTTTFAALEQPIGPLTDAAEAVLERYYTVKVSSLQFCGPVNFGMSFWDGLDALALTLPAILWITRALQDLPREEAVIRALQVVDHPFGYSPLLGARRMRFSLGLMAKRGELEKLIAWYSR